MTPQHLSHFDVGEPLGRGGMGEVYRAVDRKLRRTVAIKFLASEHLREATAQSRLMREARAAAALSHPNICTVYEVGQVQPGETVRLQSGEPVPVGTPFIAMELVEGLTLRELAGGQSKPDTKRIIRLAAQVAAGLAAAHGKGIVHRDLKPENVLVTPDGTAKILDFGLAKAQPGTTAPDDRTTTGILTAENTLLGTYPYMSPEQISGGSVDGRSDIFSFGVMLYELITGRKPFQGESPQQTLAKILEQEPVSVSHMHPGVPPELARIVHRCLRKEPGDRYNDTRDLVVALRDLEGGPAIRRPRVWVLGAGIVGSLAAIVLAVQFTPRFRDAPSGKVVPPSYRQITFTGRASAPDISPDGRYIAFLEAQANGTTRILVQDTQGGEPLEIGKQQRSPQRIRWSPDGDELLYFDPVRRRAILAHHLGQNARTLDGSWFMTWAPDGSRFAAAGGVGSVMIVDVAEGLQSSIPLEGSFLWVTGLDWSPRGLRLLFTAQDDQDRSAIWSVSTAGGQERRILESPRLLISARWSPGGDAAYYLSQGKHATDLYKVRIHPGSGEAVGDPVLVLAGLEASGLEASFSITADARVLAYSRTTVRSNLWLLARTGTGPDAAVERTQLTSGTYQDSWPRLSPDGATVAFVRNGDVFTQRLDGGPAQQRTFLGTCGEVAWAPDGASIAFGYQDGDSISVWRTDLDTSSPRSFGSSKLNSAAMWREIDVPGLSFLTWGPRDGLLYMDPGSINYQVFDPESGERSPLIRNPTGWVFNARSSPAGGDVAVFWNRKEGHGVWTIDPESGTEHRISDAIAQPICWSRDGRVVYCFDQNRKQIIGYSRDGREMSVMTLPFERIGGVTMSADGDRVVCSVLDVSQDVWTVENFDPGAP